MVALIGLGLILYQRAATNTRIDRFTTVKELLGDYRSKIRVGQTVDGDEGLKTLDALAELDVNGFEIATAPTSYFDDLTEDTNNAIADLLSVGVAKPLRTALEERADLLLPPALTRVQDDDSALAVTSQRRTGATQASMRENLGELNAFAEKVKELRSNFERYNNHDVSDLAHLFKYITGKDISDSFSKNDRLYKMALSKKDKEIWPELKFDDYRVRAKVKFEKMSAEFQEDLFTQNLLAASLGNLSDLLDTIELRQAGESYADRLLAISQAIDTVEQHIGGGKATWLLPEAFKPGGAYVKLVEHLDGDAFPKADDPDEGKTAGLGGRFEKLNQQLFGELRNKVWGAESRSGNFRLLGQQDGKVVLSDDLDRVKRHVARYMAQPYVTTDDQTKYQLDVARKAGLRDGWNEPSCARYSTGGSSTTPTATPRAMSCPAR